MVQNCVLKSYLNCYCKFQRFIFRKNSLQFFEKIRLQFLCTKTAASMSYELLALRLTNVNRFRLCSSSNNNLFFTSFWIVHANNLSIHMYLTLYSLLVDKIYLYKLLCKTYALQSHHKLFSCKNSFDRCNNTMLCCSSLFWSLNYPFR